MCDPRGMAGFADDVDEARARFELLQQTRDNLVKLGLTPPPELEVERSRLAVRFGPSPEVALTAPAAMLGGAAPREAAPVGAGVHVTVPVQMGGVAAGVIEGGLHIHPPAPAAPDEAALHAYHRWVAAGCERLAMRLLAPEQNDATHSEQTPELARVYIALDTTLTEHKEPLPQRGAKRSPDMALSGEKPPRRLSVLEVMARHRHVVLLGHPGYGKSTIVQHTALCLARDGSAPQAGWDRQVSGLGCRGSDALPVVVLLRDLAATLPATLPAPSAEILRAFLADRLTAAGLSDALAPFWRALSAGKALVLLDGLDEVPGAETRRFLRDVVAAFADVYPDCRYLVTCRVLPWHQEKLSLRGFTAAEIASFDGARIEAFIVAWHAELVRLGRVEEAMAARLQPQLREAIRTRPGLATLAENPLLLTVMAIVHTKGGELPEGEALLYKEAVEVLLWRWQDTVSALSPKKVLAEVGARDSDLLDALRRLAFTVHGSTPVTAAGQQRTADSVVADIPEAALLEALMPLDPNEGRQWARRLVETLKVRAGLLLERAPQVYTFPHRTFQELLAGWHLSLQRDFDVQAAGLLRADATRWRKAVLLAAGLLAAEPRLGELKALMDELCPATAEDTDAAWLDASWAGELLDVIGPRRLGRLRAERDLVGRVQRRLCALLTGGKLAPRERAEAGRVLGRIGDPRFREEAWGLPADETLGFVKIPAGPFWMGSDKGVDKHAHDDEFARHSVTLPEVWMARYPVTVGQWRAFVKAAGYQPGDRDSLLGDDNEPVRFVSWNEAVDYTRWLDTTLRTWSESPVALKRLLESGYRVTLPSEAEWEKAARGTEGRIWPWGNSFEERESDRANAHRVVGSVSPVGAFPSGMTLEGLHDLAGNVFEWTRSVFADYPYSPTDGREDMKRQESRRALRGGSFVGRHQGVRCALRALNVPSTRTVNVGFRLVLSPF